QWEAAARDGLAELRARHERVAVVGLSMGGALAATICAGDAGVPALVLLAPYLDAPAGLRRVATARHLVSAGFVYFAATDPRSIHDPVERAQSLGYQTATPRLVHELVGVADRGRAALARVTAPALLVQSREDSRLSSAVAEQAFHSLGSTDKRLVWLEGCGHVITVDFGRERVARLVAEWLQRAVR
ncbi:MAG: alpha/beta hydrolase, partial [Gemmatimonadaceae bacterium]